MSLVQKAHHRLTAAIAASPGLGSQQDRLPRARDRARVRIWQRGLAWSSWHVGVLITLLLGCLVAGAVVVRLQGLMLAPRLTDETQEVLIGLQVYRGQALPLVGIDTYIGSLFSYLVAAAFALFGLRPEIGRLLVLVFGALGIVPTFLLGRAIGGPGARGTIVGLVAALLQAASATDILVTSRLAYSNSLTPLLSTTGLCLLHRAAQRRSGPTLAASGLAFGLALQTHLAAVVIWPGAACYLLFRRQAVSMRWLLAAATLATLSVSNIIAFNVVTAGATANEILYRSSDYGGAPSAGLSGWPDRLTILLRAFSLALSGRVSEYIEPQAILSPLVLIYVGLLLVGAGVLVRRREWLPVLVILSGLLMISLLNGRLEPIVARSRHYAQLLPIGFVLVAAALIALRDGLARLGGPGAASVGVAGLIVALTVSSQLELQAYLTDRLARPEKNNRELIEAASALVQSGDLQERVYLDGQLGSAAINSNRRGLRDFEYMLTVRGQEYDIIDVAQRPLPIGRTGLASRRIVLTQESLPLAATRYRLEPLPGSPGEGARFRAYRAFPLD